MISFIVGFNNDVGAYKSGLRVLKVERIVVGISSQLTDVHQMLYIGLPKFSHSNRPVINNNKRFFK